MKTSEMKNLDVTMVRVYLTDGELHLEPLMKHLNDHVKVRGLTVFRGIAGFGQSGVLHSASLLDMSLDLPVVIEFFDESKKAESLMEFLYEMVGPGHIVSWPVKLSIGN